MSCIKERYEGGKGGTIPRAPNSPNNDTNNFFKTVHLLPNDLKVEDGGAILAFCPGRHQTSLRPWMYHCKYIKSLLLVRKCVQFK